MEILQEKIKLTVEQPDKIMNCENCGKCFYIKKFRSKGELLVMAEKVSENTMDIKCFGWVQSILYPS